MTASPDRWLQTKQLEHDGGVATISNHLQTLMLAPMRQGASLPVLVYADEGLTEEDLLGVCMVELGIAPAHLTVAPVALMGASAPAGEASGRALAMLELLPGQIGVLAAREEIAHVRLAL